jgi:hypothetical protein
MKTRSRIIIFLAASLALLLIVAGCGKSSQDVLPDEDGNVTVTPHINSISPSQNYPGGEVTIRGEGFGDGVEGEVAFQGATAEVVEWDEDRIVVIVPVTCATGTVRVSTAGRISNAVKFTVLNVPT